MAKNLESALKFYKTTKRGLSVFNITLYYQATDMVWITDWIKNPKERLIKSESSDFWTEERVSANWLVGHFHNSLVQQHP